MIWGFYDLVGFSWNYPFIWWTIQIRLFFTKLSSAEFEIAKMVFTLALAGRTVLPSDLSIGALGTKFRLTTEISSSLTPPFPSQGQLAVWEKKSGKKFTSSPETKSSHYSQICSFQSEKRGFSFLGRLYRPLCHRWWAHALTLLLVESHYQSLF